MKGTDRFVIEGVSCRLGDRQLRVVNLSVGGLFVADDGAPPTVGHEVPLEVELPGARPIHLTGRVSWINEHENPRVKALPPGYGLKIARIGFTEKMDLLRFLRDARGKPLHRLM